MWVLTKHQLHEDCSPLTNASAAVKLKWVPRFGFGPRKARQAGRCRLTAGHPPAASGTRRISPTGTPAGSSVMHASPQAGSQKQAKARPTPWVAASSRRLRGMTLLARVGGRASQ